MRSRVIAVAAVLVVACAPRVDGPLEQQRTVDRADGERLTAQLVALPGVAKAEVVLRRAVHDPLTTAPPTVPALSIVLIVDDRADRTHLEAAARRLATALVPDVASTIVVDVGVTRAILASVGPFSVETHSRAPLKATLAIALALIAILAGAIAWHHRPRQR